MTDHMEPEMAPLVAALNRLPGVATIAACHGHCKRGIWVTFRVEMLANLEPFTVLTYRDGWTVELEPAAEDPVAFGLEGPRGEQGRQESLELVAQIDEWMEGGR